MISIKTKLLPVIVIGVIILSSVFYFFSVNTQEANLNQVTIDGIIKSKNTFVNLQQDDIKMLKMGINNLLSNETAMSLYLQDDRDNLIKTSTATFEKSKALGQSVYQFNKYDLNDPNKLTVFARVHNPKKFGDAVTRTGNRVARDTKDWGYGIDLGNSGFALRVVYPVLDASGKVLGDIEFGEEMVHFLGLMNKQTGNDYVMVVDKAKVTADGWKTYTAGKNLRNNYDDMSKFLVIDSTLPDYRTIQTQCFTETTLNGATPDGNIFTKFQSTDKTYVCGGFTFNDINNQKVGTIVVIEDVTTLENTANRNNMTVLIIAILAAILLSALMVFIVSKIIIAPLEKIVEVSTRVAGGDFDVQIDIHTNDEIGQLAGTIEMFKEIMVNTAKDLEKAEEKK